MTEDPASTSDRTRAALAGVPILMYHHVVATTLDPPPVFGSSYVTRVELAQQLSALSRWGYRSATLAHIFERAAEGRDLRRTVALTFDDGCSCLLDNALPELSDRGMTATVFAVSGEIGGSNRWDHGSGERVERLCTGDELRTLAAAGIEIGSHGHSHRDLTLCSDDDRRSELELSRASLGDLLGTPIDTFCYPYGRTDRNTVAAVRAAGYRTAVSIGPEHGADASDPCALPRWAVGPGDSRLELFLKVTGAYRWLRRLPRLGLLSHLRRRQETA